LSCDRGMESLPGPQQWSSVSPSFRVSLRNATCSSVCSFLKSDIQSQNWASFPSNMVLYHLLIWTRPTLIRAEPLIYKRVRHRLTIWGLCLGFPERVFTEEEVLKARELIKKGHRHRLRVKGSTEFKKSVREALKLIKTAGYYDFLRTYIRQIVEIEGFSQLHEGDSAIWANKPMLVDIVDAASYMVQKAQQMKDYIEGRLYYGTGEATAMQKRVEFLEVLRKKSRNRDVKDRCKELLKRWSESRFQFP